ncbi:uncharacterized protein LOC135843708 [Planococcus citri]|uniref:uncharacterized protein LOC135843708 n=1 Tax=Planococcus citri TaxID=170843 RepID=UPI0031F96AC5
MMKIFIIFFLCLYSESAIYGQRLPDASSSFTTMRSLGLDYIDKSAFIEKLLDLQEPRFVILTRPRGFGKTAFVDMLNEFFSGNKTLFNGLYIAKRFPGKWTKYPIIKLDFSTLSPVNSIGDIDIYQNELEDRLCAIGKTYELDCASNRLVNLLINNLRTKYGEKVVILIDEYDKPFQKVNRTDSHLFDVFIRTAETFFSRIKQMGDSIELLFITGISRILVLNNLKDLTFDKNFSSAMGFTLEEIKTNYEPSLKQLATHYGMNEVSQIIADLTYWYGGYRFSLKDNETKVYNPVSVISCLRNLEMKSYWIKTKSIEPIIKRMKISQKNIEEFYYYNVEADDLDRLYDDEYSSRIPIAVLLHNYGYLTIKRYVESSYLAKIYDEESDHVILGYPNKEIEDEIKGRLYPPFESTYVHAINMSLREGDMESFIGFLNDKAFRNFNLPKSRKPKKFDQYTVTRQILNALIDSEIGAVYSNQLTRIGEDGQTKGDIDLPIRSINCQLERKTQFERKSPKYFKSDVVITIEIKVRDSAIKAMLQLLEYAVKHTDPFRMEIDKCSKEDLPTRTNLLAVNIEKIQNQRVKIQDWIAIPYRDGKIFVNEMQSSSKTAFYDLHEGWNDKKSNWGSADLESEKEIVVWLDEPWVATEETTVTSFHTTSESTTTDLSTSMHRPHGAPMKPKKPRV